MFKIEIVPVEKLLLNDNNPRYIRDKEFLNLVKSIQDFPEMLHARPIAVCSKYTVLGGNMRTRACIDAGLNEVPVIVLRGLTETQKREFILKDNGSFGEWDWNALANEWSDLPLQDWGIHVPDTSEFIEDPNAGSGTSAGGESDNDFLKMEFTFSTEQFNEIKRQIDNAKKRDEFCLYETDGNEDQNAVALYLIMTNRL